MAAPGSIIAALSEAATGGNSTLTTSAFSLAPPEVSPLGGLGHTPYGLLSPGNSPWVAMPHPELHSRVSALSEKVLPVLPAMEVSLAWRAGSGSPGIDRRGPRKSGKQGGMEHS